MTVTRRRFLRSGAMSVFVTGLALDSIPQAFAQQSDKHDPAQNSPAAAGQESTLTLNRETFQPYLHGDFKLRAGANTAAATLASIRDCTPTTKIKMTGKSRPSRSFALVFRSEEKLTDLTSVYGVEHAALGTFPLFLSRRKGPQGKYFYEAVFNHAL